LSLASVLFVVQVPPAGDAAVLEHRLEALKTFYSPLGVARAERKVIPDLGLTVGAIRFDAPGRPEPRNLWVWGEAPPARLATAEDLLDADDDLLRSIEGMTAAVAVADRRARIVTAADGPVTLYEAGSTAIRAWSTHAVAAAWLARGRVEVSADVLPELMAFDFVGGERTLITSVSAVSPATSIEIRPTGARKISYWSTSARWAPVPEADAYAHAEWALLASLERRVKGEPSVALGLTAGLDSRVVAAALAELDVSFSAFTWGDPGWPEVRGACEVATAFGVEHRPYPPQWLDDAQATSAHERNVRWADGAFALAPSERSWPSVATHLIGMGGETGRAFYYRGLPHPRSPTAAQLAATVGVERRIPGASPEAIASARAAVARWIDAAGACGHEGWRLLDVMYAEQRVRRWGRTQVPRLVGSLVPCFATPEVSRSLASLPLAERLSDGFHRRFLAERVPSLAPPPPPSPGRLRVSLATLRRRLRPRVRPPTPIRTLAAQLWAERPECRTWVTDDVLRRPLFLETMGRALGGGHARGVPAGRAAGDPPGSPRLRSGDSRRRAGGAQPPSECLRSPPAASNRRRRPRRSHPYAASGGTPARERAGDGIRAEVVT